MHFVLQLGQVRKCSWLRSPTYFDDTVTSSDKSWEDLLVKTLDTDSLTPADVNRKRKQLTFAAFGSPAFVPRTLLLEYLMVPMQHYMGILLKRSSTLTSLHRRQFEDKAAQADMMERPSHVKSPWFFHRRHSLESRLFSANPKDKSFHTTCTL